MFYCGLPKAAGLELVSSPGRPSAPRPVGMGRGAEGLGTRLASNTVAAQKQAVKKVTAASNRRNTVAGRSWEASYSSGAIKFII